MTGSGTKTQITVRLRDDLVEFIDAVKDASGISRAEALTTLLEHERTRQRNERDARIYASTEPDEDSRSYEAWAQTRDYPVLDDTNWSHLGAERSPV